jgi:hypothetical protein
LLLLLLLLVAFSVVALTRSSPPARNSSSGVPEAPLGPPARLPKTTVAGADGAPSTGGQVIAEQRIVDQALSSMRFGQIAFNTPESIQLGDSFELQLLLSLRDSARQLQKRITAIGRRQGARIRVSDQMEARLTGFGFDIEAITPEQQAVSDRARTEWRWDAKGTQVGTHRMHLTLSALLNLGGERTTWTVRTFDRTLTVRVTWMRRTSRFVTGNWQWLWAAIVLPGAGWLIRTRRRARAADQTPA